MKKSNAFGMILCILLILFISSCGGDLLSTAGTGTSSTGGETGGTTGTTGGDSGSSGGGSTTPSWKDVGSPGFSTGEVEYVSFAGDPNGNLYVGYQDKGDNYKGVAKKGTFSGNWEEVYKTTDLGNASVTVNDSGVLFAAFGENNYQPSIKKYISGNLENINGFPQESFAYPPKIRTFRSNSLYVLQIMNGNVYKYTGSTWEYCNVIGSPTAGNVSLFVRQDMDIPYAAFSDSNRAGYVKKYVIEAVP
jgi:hypothetical protein